MKMERLVIHTAGASLGNPGPASIGVTIKDGQGRLVTSISHPLGRTPNNQAEYRAISAALEQSVELGASQIDIQSD